MKRVCIFLFALLLLFTGCQSKTETDGGKNNAINDPITDPDATETTEEGKTDSENGDPDGDSTEEELPGCSDIQTVDVGALGIHNLVFEGCALETSLPTKWQFEQKGVGEYTIYRDGVPIGEATSGSAATEGWIILDDDYFESETGVIINSFVEKREEEDIYRRRLYFSLQESPWASATVCVSYEQLDETTMYRIWRESKPSALKNYPNYDYLYDIDEGDTVLILGNSFIASSRIGFILRQMCENAPFTVGVESVSRGYAQVGTYTSDPAVMQAIREGKYGCVFICGFYSEGEIANLKLLKAACDASDTMLVVFPAHNENATVIQRAIDSDDTLYYLPWRDEINALINAGVDLWDMCINDVHKHSTPLAGYVGAHMIYRAIFDESPSSVSIEGVLSAYEIEETFGNIYVQTGVVCAASERILVFS